MRVLTREEQKTLIITSRNHRLGIVVILDLFTGMRLVEMVALRWNDIDFNKNLIYVRNTIKRVTAHNSDGSKTEIILDTPKTDTSYRVIPLIGEMKIELKQHLKIQNKEKQISGYNNKNFVFCNEIGAPYDQKTFKNYYNKIFLECGLINDYTG